MVGRYQAGQYREKPMTDYDPLAALSDIHAKRGYLLPHHGLMAISTPDLLERYDSLYSTLALTERHLSRHAHEFIWLGVLISCEESLGSHHVKRFVDAGGDAAHLGLATAISAMAKGSEGYLFVEDHWVPHLPAVQPTRTISRCVSTGDRPRRARIGPHDGLCGAYLFGQLAGSQVAN